MQAGYSYVFFFFGIFRILFSFGAVDQRFSLASSEHVFCVYGTPSLISSIWLPRLSEVATLMLFCIDRAIDQPSSQNIVHERPSQT